MSIVNSTISVQKKEQRLDSLLLSYELDNKFDILFYDLYYYALWHYKYTKNYTKAIKVCHKGISVADKTDNIDEDKLAGIRNSAGFFYECLGKYDKAFIEYKTLTKSTHLKTRLAKAYNRMGECKRILGDFYEASDYFETSLIIAKEIDTSLYVKFAISTSTNYKQIASTSSYKKGINLLSSVIESIDKNEINKDNVSNVTLIQLYNSLGNLYGDRTNINFFKAEENLNKALSIAKEINNSNQLGYLYNDLGYLYARAGKADAIVFLEKAINNIDDLETLSICYSNKAFYYSKINDKSNALLNADKAIGVLLSKSNSSSNILRNDSVEGSLYKYELLTALIEKSKLIIKFSSNSKSKAKKLNEALKTLKLADFLADNIRLESSEEKSKLFWRTIASDIYTNATKVCFELNKPEDAFYFMEKNKAILLLEDLTLQQLKVKNKIPETIFNRQNELKRNIVELNQNLNSLLNKNEKDTIQAKFLTAKAEYNSFLDSLSVNYSAYAKTQKPVKLYSFKEAKQSLSKTNSSYLSYIINDNSGYGFYISETKTDFFEIKDVDSLLKLSIDYRALLEVPFKNKTDIETYNNIALKLYNKLIPESISKDMTGKKLIIIPDFYLQNIPFESLITSKENKYFIQNNDISYAYSVTFLNENQKVIRENSNQFLGIAPVQFNEDLSSLPGSEIEINAISKHFASNNLTKEQATSTNYTNYAKGNDIIHFATHAFANDTINPWIAFADKKMTLNELYLTENTADLIVLNACKTSLGEINKGEGVMSLARGFFNTGANSVMSSLWNVNDKSNTIITTSFYNYLKNGKTKSTALIQAKLDYLNTHSLSEASPYYWSSLVLIGDDSSIKFNSNNWIFYILGLLIVSLIFFFLKKRKTLGNI